MYQEYRPGGYCPRLRVGGSWPRSSDRAAVTATSSRWPVRAPVRHVPAPGRSMASSMAPALGCAWFRNESVLRDWAPRFPNCSTMQGPACGGRSARRQSTGSAARRRSSAASATCAGTCSQGTGSSSSEISQRRIRVSRLWRSRTGFDVVSLHGATSGRRKVSADGGVHGPAKGERLRHWPDLLAKHLPRWPPMPDGQRRCMCGERLASSVRASPTAVTSPVAASK